MNKIDELAQYSEDKLKMIRDDLLSKLDNKSFSIVTTGSYGRKEASIVSDIDMYIVVDEENEVSQSDKNIIQDIIDKYIKKDTGSTDTFGIDAIVKVSDLVSNYGGDKDTNENLTRRMLLLLEGTYLYNEERFNIIRKNILEHYIKDYTDGKHIATFFLNDMIRYYRTIVTDFEYKTIEKKKEWGVRNIKLRFSRKLLYFSGLLLVAETVFSDNRDAQIADILKLMNLTPLDRIKKVCDSEANGILEIYEYFLNNISSKENRESLDKATPQKDSNQPNLFKDMKEKSNQFSEALFILLTKTYNKEHEIHHKLLF